LLQLQDEQARTRLNHMFVAFGLPIQCLVMVVMLTWVAAVEAGVSDTLRSC
jgi:hypothetical protein